MLKQFIKISLRYLARNKGVTIINIVGLTFGITFSILIGLYIKKELSIDKSFAQGDRIYRLEFEYPERGRNAVMVSAVGPDLRKNLAGIKNVLRIQFWDDIVLKKDDANYYNIRRVCLADSNRDSLISQFLVESFIISTISTLLAIMMAELLLPYFNNLTGNELDIIYLDNPFTIPVLIAIIVFTGILAGIFVTGAIISISVAIFTTVSIILRAAISNPADSLRYE